MQVAADDQGFAAVDGPALRGIDSNRHVERNAFVSGDAADGDRQGTAIGAVEDIARGPGANGHAVGDDGSADRDVRITRCD